MGRQQEYAALEVSMSNYPQQAERTDQHELNQDQWVPVTQGPVGEEEDPLVKTVARYESAVEVDGANLRHRGTGASDDQGKRSSTSEWSV